MSTFACLVKTISAIEPIANADAIEVAVVGGWRCVVRKNTFSVGNLAVYIPEASVLPEWLLKEMGFWDDSRSCGTLAGSEGNRVKAVRIRGELSQGVLYPVHTRNSDYYVNTSAGPIQVVANLNVASILGVTKWQPPIPVAMAGDLFNAGTENTLAFDVENWKAFPDVIMDGEEVVFTEKLHGTFCAVAIFPRGVSFADGFGENKNILVFSKGLGAKGLVFKNNETNKNNVYVRALEKHMPRLNLCDLTEPLFVLGEVYGKGIQDLTYDSLLPNFRVFAMAKGGRGSVHWVSWDSVRDLAYELDMETVPELYRGPFSREVMMSHTRGASTLGGHIREGIVMVPLQERFDPQIGRVCLKSVSEDYLMRKNGTEFN